MASAVALRITLGAVMPPRPGEMAPFCCIAATDAAWMRLNLLMDEERTPETDSEGNDSEAEEWKKKVQKFGLASSPGECGQRLSVQPLVQMCPCPGQGGKLALLSSWPGGSSILAVSDLALFVLLSPLGSLTEKRYVWTQSLYC